MSLSRTLAHAKRNLFTLRHWTTEERRAMQRAAAKDPAVDRAVRQLLAERPEFRKKDTQAVGVQDRRD